ncbi:MAG: hypothetical protein AB7S41_08970 [Parvibaculaceae bacterium]
MFRLTWKPWVMPSGRRLSRLAASALPTSASELGSWPTPNSEDAKAGTSDLEHRKQQSLPRTASRLSDWPTTSARDWKGATHDRWGENARPLNEVARLAPWSTPRANKWGFPDAHGSQEAPLAGWATPAAQEPGGTAEAHLARKRKAAAAGSAMGTEAVTALSLQAQLSGWPTPTSLSPAKNGNNEAGNSAGLVKIRELALGPISNGSPAETAKPGQLNPDFSRWLMGYPAEWASCAPTATPSSRKSGRRSSEPVSARPTTSVFD